MSARPLLVVGDTLLDVDVDGDVERLCPEAPVPVLDERARHARPGGAGLAATLAAADGRPVTLVTAVAEDEAGRALRSLLELVGVAVVDLGLAGTTPTKTRLRAEGRLVLRVDDGDGGAVQAAAVPETALDAIGNAAAVLVADYGRGVAKHAALRRALADRAAGCAVVWDPHPSGADPLTGVDLVTPNRREAVALAPPVEETKGLSADVERARVLARRWEAAAVAVTLGAEGALLVAGDAAPLAFPTKPTPAADPCGAGDRFASAVAGALADGELLPDAVATAVRVATSFVRDGGAGSVRFDPPPAARPEASTTAEKVVARVRAVGGTVVMAGGCFDVLHAGHVETLQAARSLGDCLVVCLNSDRSVRRLKGADRPLVPEEERAAVLRALGCVDAVVVFDEDTPAAVLEAFRPDLFAKGGDYSLEQLPETEILSRWGGEVVVLPYVEGRSTTRLIQEILVRAG